MPSFTAEEVRALIAVGAMLGASGMALVWLYWQQRKVEQEFWHNENNHQGDEHE